ncbi:hypothetical protein V8F06_006985 [Rhypophila decipiens]
MGDLIRQHVSDEVLSEPQEGHQDATVRSRQEAPLQLLANEIKIMIFKAVLSLPPRLPDDYVHRPQPAASDSDNLGDLVRLSMTCKALRTAALPVIYRRIDSAFARNLEGANQLAFLRTLYTDISLGRLVRSADLLMLGKHHPHNRRRSCDDCIEFLEEIGLKFCSEHAMVAVPSMPSRRNLPLLSWLLSLYLFHLPSVRYLRIPSYENQILSFRQVESRPFFFIFHDNSVGGPYSFEWKRGEHAFPELRELEIVSHIPKHDEPIQLDPLQPLGYLVRRSPSLCTLARLCTNLRKFKISNSAHRDHRIDTQAPWHGEPGFSSNIPLDLKGEDDCGIPEDGEILYCSDQVTASLVLDALSAVSATLESIYLGRCTPARIRVDLFRLYSLNYNRRKLSIAKFERLKTFAIRSANLFPGFYSPNTADYDQVLSSILNERPTLESIKIVSRHRWEWSWGGQLERAVRNLGQELVKSYPCPYSLRSLTLGHLIDRKPGGRLPHIEEPYTCCSERFLPNWYNFGSPRSRGLWRSRHPTCRLGVPGPTWEMAKFSVPLGRLDEDEYKLGREFRGLVCPKLEADILVNFVSAGVEVVSKETENGVLFKLREGAATDYPHAPNLDDVPWETYLEIDPNWL